ncbi:MAG: hypothetical protein IH936_12670, partial [Acidobacteria bacterium]|nr:hypothetical protein [Acidobacteriota bacterium]
MKTKTTHMTIGGAVLSLAALAVLATAATGQEPALTEDQRMQVARQVELVELLISFLLIFCCHDTLFGEI